MYELYPYFTNDGTVGLFSPQDDDIYHSTYGALTESWQKFIIPSRLEEFVADNESVKILDICYGIGYNTKAALSVFVENYLKQKKIGDKNNKIKKNKYKNFSSSTTSIAPIDTDNISNKNIANILQKNDKISSQSKTSIEALYTDNVSNDKCNKLHGKSCNKILVDAVDVDEVLIELSSFIRIKPKRKYFFTKPTSINEKKGKIDKNKFSQVKKIQSAKKSNLKKEYKLRNEISIIILEKLQEQRRQKKSIISETSAKILDEKKYTSFLSKFMLNLSSFYQNKGYNYNKKQNKMTFLHNIYYRYISKSYKSALKLLENLQFDLNFHNIDARAFIKSTDTLYDFIFLDAFTPAKCPALWSIEFFKELHSHLNDNGVILTYSNSAAIRNAFLQNGFHVGKIYDKHSKKFLGTIASKNINLIDYKLNEYDLGLINSRAGICYRDENLDLDNSKIIENRNIEVNQSELLSSSKYIKGARNVELL